MYRVVDMHCDTIPAMYDRKNEGQVTSLAKNDLHIDLQKMKEGHYGCQCFSLFTYLQGILEKGIAPFDHVTSLAKFWQEEIGKYPEQIRQVFSYQDILENEKAGRISAVMTVEEGAVYEGKLENLYHMYDMGVRMSTLTWNFENELAYPNPKGQKGQPPMPDTMNGLKKTGIAFVEEMERLGILVDISHLNDAGIWDVFEYVKGPVIASHSNARALCPSLRNLSDAMIRTIGEKGGVIGVNFFAGFLHRPEVMKEKGLHATADDFVRHMQYLKNVGGIDCVGLGSDFDGISGTLEVSHAGKMDILADAMSKGGFSTREIEKIMGENVLRVFREVWK